VDASPPSLRNVAALAGVGISSASRALSIAPRSAPSFARASSRPRSSSANRPNPARARGCARAHRLSVGFIVRDISASLFAEIALGAETALRERVLLDCC